MGLRFRAVACLFLCCSTASKSADAADTGAIQTVTFARRAPAEGDVGRQSVVTNTSMNVSVHLGQQLVHENATLVERSQERTVRLTHVEPDAGMAAEVTYHQARQSVATGSDEAEAIQLPVEGRTYRVERRGDELQILDQQGLVPRQEEFEVIWHSMESFGKANPLAGFLEGRTVAVGESLDLPTEAAVHLLAFGDDLVAVEQFTLTLEDVQVSAADDRRAVFRAFVSSRSHGQSQMGMQVEGRLTVDAATCRVVALDLAGPIGMTETRTNGPDTYLVSGRGKIHVRMQGTYTKAH